MHKVLTATVVVTLIVVLSTSATTTVTGAYALSPYQSGYRHGVSDAQKAAQGLGGHDWYITQPGKGFAFHTTTFNRGYVDGFCSHSPPGTGSDADEATFECP
jgi:hypothetical protein